MVMDGQIMRWAGQPHGRLGVAEINWELIMGGKGYAYDHICAAAKWYYYLATANSIAMILLCNDCTLPLPAAATAQSIPACFLYPRSMAITNFDFWWFPQLSARKHNYIWWWWWWTTCGWSSIAMAEMNWSHYHCSQVHAGLSRRWNLAIENASFFFLLYFSEPWSLPHPSQFW